MRSKVDVEALIVQLLEIYVLQHAAPETQLKPIDPVSDMFLLQMHHGETRSQYVLGRTAMKCFPPTECY